jgi:hypothetical protein
MQSQRLCVCEAKNKSLVKQVSFGLFLIAIRQDIEIRGLVYCWGLAQPQEISYEEVNLPVKEEG